MATNFFETKRICSISRRDLPTQFKIKTNYADQLSKILSEKGSIIDSMIEGTNLGSAGLSKEPTFTSTGSGVATQATPKIKVSVTAPSHYSPSLEEARNDLFG